MLKPILTEVEGKPNVKQIELDAVKESIKHVKRLPDETFEAYKQRMRDTNKALKYVTRGRVVYDSSNMVPFKVQ